MHAWWRSLTQGLSECDREPAKVPFVQPPIKINTNDNDNDRKDRTEGATNRGGSEGGERASREVGQRDLDLTQGLISMTFLCGGETQTLCSANCEARFPQTLRLPLNHTVQMHPTCLPAPQGGNIVHQQHSLSLHRLSLRWQ